mmetsp:Transcript_9686/g.19891  ORF Transcript_9686/g.19891 Transcript_9686/m.19891 type:complete len:343 (+) Transcript_9686:209-1237(+)
MAASYNSMPLRFSGSCWASFSFSMMSHALWSFIWVIFASRFCFTRAVARSAAILKKPAGPTQTPLIAEPLIIVESVGSGVYPKIVAEGLLQDKITNKSWMPQTTFFAMTMTLQLSRDNVPASMYTRQTKKGSSSKKRERKASTISARLSNLSWADRVPAHQPWMHPGEQAPCDALILGCTCVTSMTMDCGSCWSVNLTLYCAPPMCFARPGRVGFCIAVIEKAEMSFAGSCGIKCIAVLDLPSDESESLPMSSASTFTACVSLRPPASFTYCSSCSWIASSTNLSDSPFLNMRRLSMRSVTAFVYVRTGASCSLSTLRRKVYTTGLKTAVIKATAQVANIAM